MSAKSEKVVTLKNSTTQYIRSYMMVIALILIWLLFAIITEGVFTTPRNLSNLFRQMTVTGIASIGMAVVIIAGNFDLSTGSVIGATGALAAIVMRNFSFGPAVAILITLIFGVFIGLFQGFWIAYAGIPAFIVTLGGSLIFRGVVLWITGSNTIALNDPTFIFIGQGYLSNILGYILSILAITSLIALDLKRRADREKRNFKNEKMSMAILKYVIAVVLIIAFTVVMNAFNGVPFPLAILIALALIISFFLTKTKPGRYLYAVGGNSEAAHLSGINNKKIVLGSFLVLGFTGALSGIVSVSRLAAAMPSGGEGLELDAIASCVIGGVSLSGGKGKVWGAILGALVMASLSNGMSLMSWDTYIQNIVKGFVLILAVWLDVQNQNKR